ncbi:MAG: hypothetical protein BGP12_21215 [Rhodospirillales bacterium 70-18]|nr:MAG: hypothetical protein BGP12_21215 [Rhodospirillales bacterium 70-18]
MGVDMSCTSDADELAAALRAHRDGRLAEAEALYRRVLDRAPGEPMAPYLLGLLTLSDGRAAEAEMLLRYALALRPHDTDTSRALARACAATGARGEAIDLYRAVLAARPDDAAAGVNLANVLRDEGALAEAEAACRAALALRSDLMEGHVTLGSILLAAGDATSAVDAYRAAVALRPDSAVAHTGLGMALLHAGQAAEALDASGTATLCGPALAEAWFVAGTALRALGRAGEALDSLQRAVRLDAGHARAWMNLGHAAADLDRPAAAENYLNEAIARDPGLAEAHASLGAVLTEAGRLPAAVAACDRALALRPGMAVAHWHRAVAHLLAGNFAAGWADFEWRKRHLRFAAHFRPLDGTPWDGGALVGRSILLRAEQGLGDTIQFARYVPVLAAMGARVVLACAPALASLLAQLPAEIVPNAGHLPATDCWADLLSLPYLLGTRPETIPAPEGYLCPPPGRRVTRAGLARGGLLRVGLIWAGNPAHRNDTRRSLPGRAVAAILAAAEAAPGLRFTSLQHGPRGAEAAALYDLPDRSADMTDFAATAALIDGLDLVVAADTAVAHLAGAMGKPVWLLLPFAPDWRWMAGRADSPWYAGMRLFRQSAPGDWGSVAARVAAGLIARCGAAGDASRAVAGMPSAAAAATPAPQAMPIAATRGDQPRGAARLVMS